MYAAPGRFARPRGILSGMIGRREFLLGGAAAAITSRKGFGFAVERRKIAVRAEVEIGAIRPELHGHFAEHLGSCTYGGLWVGPASPIPNLHGYRKQAVEYLRELGVPVLRWPGGCFADDYHWRDGIGPPAKRPTRVNIHWGNYTEDNSFGTHEFIGLCRLIGAEPYLAGNVGSGTPQELRDWVEYCNYPAGSALAEERAANEAREPFRVKYWGVGNENWGCGGDMTPEEYAAHYRRFAGYVRAFGDTRTFRIACGPNENDTEWSRRLLAALGERRRMVEGFSMHFYSWGKSQATKYTVETMREQLSSFALMEQAIRQQRAILDGFDPERKIGLIVDEWGVWDRMDPEEEKRYGRLWQQITMRGAVAAALGLNVFHRQADKLIMCNIAQTVNVLHSMLLAHERHCIRTPAYYAFELAKPHRGKTAVAVEAEDASPLGLSCSASRSDKELALTLVNPRHDAGLSVEAALPGVAATGATARMLHHEGFNACNTFDSPDRVVPRVHEVRVEDGRLAVELPPMAIVTVVMRTS